MKHDPNQQAPNQSRAEISSKRRALFYMLLPVVLLVTSVGGWIVMISIAVDDPGFAVESDYYKKAANYDAVMAQKSQNARLGWGVELLPSSKQPDQLLVRAWDGQGDALIGAQVSAEAFPVARASHVRNLDFERADEPGLYRARLEAPRPGLWEVRLVVQRGAQRYTEVLRPEFVGGS